MSADATGEDRLSFPDDGLDIDDSGDRYGYPFTYEGREFYPVPTSWLVHGQVEDVSPHTYWVATSAAHEESFAKVVVRYVPVDGAIDAVRILRFDLAGPSGDWYPKPLESGRWPAVLHVSSFYPEVDTVRLGEREYLHEVLDAAGGEP